MIWKETRELLNQGASKTGNIVRQLFVVAFFGIFYPWQMGERFISGAGPFVALFPILLVITVTITVESFAGERERHTLETLLSTRLSDDAILFRKTFGHCSFVRRHDPVTDRQPDNDQSDSPPTGSFVAVCAERIHCSADRDPAVVDLAFGTLAVLISLRSATVRQAGQTIGFGLMIPFIVGLFAFRRLPVDLTQISFLKLFNDANLWQQTEIVIVLLVAALIAVLVFIARLRFRRARSWYWIKFFLCFFPCSSTSVVLSFRMSKHKGREKWNRSTCLKERWTFFKSSGRSRQDRNTDGRFPSGFKQVSHDALQVGQGLAVSILAPA